jgi:branched-subunit amino acid ABC-type transport system permease component
VIYIDFLILGLAGGAVYAALGLGLVITFRSSGVINFAIGAMAMYSAYTYEELINNGGLLIPIPGLPVHIHLGNHVPFAPAVAITLAVSGLLGLLLYWAVFYPLRNALPLSKIVATLGILTVLQSVIGIRLGVDALTVPNIFTQHLIHLGGLRLPEDRLLFSLAIVILAAVVWAIYRYTRFGLATLAAAESEKGATLIGLRPTRIAAINWVIAGVVAAIGGILISPIVPLTPDAYSLFIVPALAVALIGNFSSIWLTVIAGLALGAVQSELTYFQAAFSWFPHTGVDQAFPFVVIVIVLFVRGSPFPGRGTIVLQTLPTAFRSRHIVPTALIAGGAGAIALMLMHGAYRDGVITSLIFGIIGLSTVVITGLVGQISLAQLAFAGIAGFLLSRFTTLIHIPFPLAPLLASLAAGAVGVLIGLPALRVRGVNLAIVTMAAAVSVEAIYFNNDQLNGGIKGAPVIGPKLFGLDLSVGGGAAFPRIGFALFTLLCLVLTACGVAALRRSNLGLQMLAIRADESAAAASGINVARTKLIAFAIAATMAGGAGTLIGYQQTQVGDASFTTLAAISFFALVYLSGITSTYGGVLSGFLAAGGLSYVLFTQAIHEGRWFDIISGLGLILTAIFNPKGIAGELMEKVEIRRERRSRAQAGGSPDGPPGPTTPDPVPATPVAGVGAPEGA